MNAPRHPLILDPSQQIPNKAFRSRWERQLGQTESPIEARFLEAFCEAALEANYYVGPAPKAGSRSDMTDTIGVQPQKVLDQYRLDFAILFNFQGAYLQIAIECDGHAFHERTKQQAVRDKRRDRALSALDYEIMRFAGSEIFADAGKCAAEVINRIQDFQTTQVVKAFKTAEATHGQD